MKYIYLQVAWLILFSNTSFELKNDNKDTDSRNLFSLIWCLKHPKRIFGDEGSKGPFFQYELILPKLFDSNNHIPLEFTLRNDPDMIKSDKNDTNIVMCVFLSFFCTVRCVCPLGNVTLPNWVIFGTFPRVIQSLKGEPSDKKYTSINRHISRALFDIAQPAKLLRKFTRK